MTKNEIVGRLKGGGLDASSTNRSAAVYVKDAREGRATAGWFAFRIICDSDATERRARAILSRYYDIEASGDVWRLKSKKRIPLMAIKRGAAPSTNGYMYLEAAQANSTVSMVSTLETAPNLEYSTDGVTWQEWGHTTADGTHTFDTITLGAIGDKVYFRGDNPDGLANSPTMAFSNFQLTGAINGGGNVMSLLDKTMALTEVPAGGFGPLFTIMGEGIEPALLTPPLMDTITTIADRGCDSMYYGCTSLTAAADMPALTSIGEGGCNEMYTRCTSLTAAADMPALTTIGAGGCNGMYSDCTFNMSDDGTTLNFDFPTPPVTDGNATFSTAYDVAQWMGNTHGIKKIFPYEFYIETNEYDDVDDRDISTDLTDMVVTNGTIRHGCISFDNIETAEFTPLSVPHATWSFSQDGGVSYTTLTVNQLYNGFANYSILRLMYSPL